MKLTGEMRQALLLLREHGPLHRSTGRREHNVGWRFVRPGTADALERRGLVSVSYSVVRLTDAGRRAVQRLADDV